MGRSPCHTPEMSRIRRVSKSSTLGSWAAGMLVECQPNFVDLSGGLKRDRKYLSSQSCVPILQKAKYGPVPCMNYSSLAILPRVLSRKEFQSNILAEKGGCKD